MLDTIREKWPDILYYLKNEYDISDVSFNTWLRPLEVARLEDNTIFIIAPEESIGLQYIKKKYYLPLKVSIGEVLKKDFEIEFILPDQVKDLFSAAPEISGQQDVFEKAGLNPKYTFSNFVVGDNNNLAHAASLAVAESPAEIYNPLYIYGGVGLGKTHLLLSIGNYVRTENPGVNLIYIKAEDFMNHMIRSLQTGGMEEFRKKYRKADLLLMDDIQFLSNKEDRKSVV